MTPQKTEPSRHLWVPEFFYPQQRPGKAKENERHERHRDMPYRMTVVTRVTVVLLCTLSLPLVFLFFAYS
jgi:hypothetical protein